MRNPVNMFAALTVAVFAAALALSALAGGQDVPINIHDGGGNGGGGKTHSATDAPVVTGRDSGGQRQPTDQITELARFYRGLVRLFLGF